MYSSSTCAASGKYTAVYGALDGAVIAMLAIYLAVYVVLLLNSQLDRTRASHADPAETR